MKFPRRAFLRLAASAAALPALPRISLAQAYPSGPVCIVVGFAAGGATDIQTRLMGQWLSDRPGQQFIVENRADASGIRRSRPPRSPNSSRTPRRTRAKINYGSAGSGTPQNIACELFKMMAEVDLVHVPYRGGAPAATDLVAGHLQVIFAPISESIQHIKAGKLRALAVTTAACLDVLPDVPTVAEFVPGYEASGFAGIWRAQEYAGRDH